MRKRKIVIRFDEGMLAVRTDGRVLVVVVTTHVKWLSVHSLSSLLSVPLD